LDVVSNTPKRAKQQETSNTNSTGACDTFLSASHSASGANRPNRMDSQTEQANGQGEDVNIDESLYSRQLYVLGEAAMKSMASTKTLITGLNGVGLEVAKCLVLGGMKEVTLHDSEPVTMNDLSSNYYVSKADKGKNRALCVRDKVAELNSYVKVLAVDGQLKEELMQQYDQIIFCPDNLTAHDISNMNFCHTNNIKYTCALSNGVFCVLFNDFGSNFLVQDPDGNEPLESFIEGITFDEKKQEVAIMCHSDKPHGFQSGMFVQFQQLSECTQLNKIEPIEITYVSPISFKFHLP